MKARFAVSLVAIVGLLALTGCKLFKGGSGSSAVESDKAKETMSYYAKGYNALIKGPEDMIKEYYDKIPSKEGPDVSKKINLFPRQNFATNDIKEAKEAFAQAKDMAPKELQHLGTFADECMKQMDTILPTFEEAYKYYQAEDYKDDKGAKAKALHEQFVKAVDAYDAAIKKFDEELAKVEEIQDASEIKKYEGDKNYSYWFRMYNLEAKHALNASKGEDLAPFLEQYKKLEAAHAQIESFSKTKGDKINSVFKSYMGNVDEYYGIAKKLNRAIEEKANEDQMDRLKDDLLSWYNNLVGMTDSLYSMESSGLLK
jgi:hypothetical protein